MLAISCPVLLWRHYFQFCVYMVYGFTPWSETYFRQDLFPAYMFFRRQFHAIVIFRLKSISDLDSGSIPSFFGEFIYAKLRMCYCDIELSKATLNLIPPCTPQDGYCWIIVQWLNIVSTWVYDNKLLGISAMETERARSRRYFGEKSVKWSKLRSPVHKVTFWTKVSLGLVSNCVFLLYLFFRKLLFRINIVWNMVVS